MKTQTIITRISEKEWKKAATDLRSDVRLITLYDRKDQEQQIELAAREIRDGAGAVVIEPVEEKTAVMDLEGLKPGCPGDICGRHLLPASL